MVTWQARTGTVSRPSTCTPGWHPHWAVACTRTSLRAAASPMLRMLVRVRRHQGTCWLTTAGVRAPGPRWRFCHRHAPECVQGL